MSLEAEIKRLKKEIEREREERRRLEIDIRKKEEVGVQRMASIMEAWGEARKGRGA